MHTVVEALQEISNHCGLQRDPEKYISSCKWETVQLAEIWVQGLNECEYQNLILGGTDLTVLLSGAPENVEYFFSEFSV
jgi:hypothetical protein